MMLLIQITVIYQFVKQKVKTNSSFNTIDNLIKGGSGQGIQNMNLKFGFPIKTGLI